MVLRAETVASLFINSNWRSYVEVHCRLTTVERQTASVLGFNEAYRDRSIASMSRVRVTVVTPYRRTADMFSRENAATRRFCGDMTLRSRTEKARRQRGNVGTTICRGT